MARVSLRHWFRQTARSLQRPLAPMLRSTYRPGARHLFPSSLLLRKASAPPYAKDRTHASRYLTNLA